MTIAIVTEATHRAFLQIGCSFGNVCVDIKKWKRVYVYIFVPCGTQAVGFWVRWKKASLPTSRKGIAPKCPSLYNSWERGKEN